MKNKKGSPGKGRMNRTGVRSWEIKGKPIQI